MTKQYVLNREEVVLEHKLSVNNYVRKYGFKDKQEFYNFYYDIETPKCSCGQNRKFISFPKGYHDFCSSDKHKEEIIKLSHERHYQTMLKGLENIDGYDEFIKEHLDEYTTLQKNSHFVDPFDGKNVSDFAQIVRKSKSSLSLFDEIKTCLFCGEDYKFNPIIYNKNHCKNKSCILLNANNSKLHSFLERSGIYFSEFSGFSNSLKRHILKNLEKFEMLSNKYGMRNQILLIRGVACEFEGLILYKLEYQRRSHFSMLQNSMTEYLDYNNCVICDKKYLRNDFIYDSQIKTLTPIERGAKYTCSLECYDKIRGNTKLFPNHDKARKKQSKLMKEKIKNGEFTPCVTNSWARSRIVVDGIPFRSSWEQYFHIHMNKFLDKNVEFEKLRIPYFDPKKKKERIYIVDFIDYTERIVYEIKPEQEKDEITKQKEEQLIQWANQSGYEYKFISDKWFSNNYKESILEDNIDNEVRYDIMRKMKQFSEEAKNES